jgi:hypothetical protein
LNPLEVLMTQKLDDVFDKLIAFECVDAKTQRRGSGTAFWLKVNDTVKLVTAAHIPWPQLPSPVPVNSGSQFCVSWSMTGGRSNRGLARIFAHPGAPKTDYAWIEFNDASLAPPGNNNQFYMIHQYPLIGTFVAATGFPGNFVASGPTPDYAIGTLQEIQNPPDNKISVAGKACGGYSGGPAFRYIDEGALDDWVIGLMSGAPSPATNFSLQIADSYILEGAVNFV